MTRSDSADAAYQGAPGAFSEDAALSLLGRSARLAACETLEHVFRALLDGQARSAVVPIENTLAGAVPGCADLLVRHDVHIAAEYVQPIRHALIAPPGVTMASVRRVLSHPVAIAQCERFFRAHPDVTPVPVFDTAGAVADVIGDMRRDSAAIASSRAASLYGGVLLEDNVQDRADNATRFLLVRPGPSPDDWQPDRKTTVACVLRDEPGALMRALEPFASRGLNLCRIESRPTRETPFEYAFHLDIAPADDASRLAAAMTELRRLSRWMRVLGHYSQMPRET